MEFVYVIENCNAMSTILIIILLYYRPSLLTLTVQRLAYHIVIDTNPHVYTIIL